PSLTRNDPRPLINQRRIWLRCFSLYFEWFRVSSSTGLAAPPRVQIKHQVGNEETGSSPHLAPWRRAIRSRSKPVVHKTDCSAAPSKQLELYRSPRSVAHQRPPPLNNCHNRHPVRSSHQLGRERAPRPSFSPSGKDESVRAL